MTLPEIRIDTDWTPKDAFVLLDAHDGCLPAAIVRLGTLHGLAVERACGVIDLHRASGLWSQECLAAVERTTWNRLANEAVRRLQLLLRVAHAHGMDGAH